MPADINFIFGSPQGCDSRRGDQGWQPVDAWWKFYLIHWIPAEVAGSSPTPGEKGGEHGGDSSLTQPATQV